MKHGQDIITLADFSRGEYPDWKRVPESAVQYMQNLEPFRGGVIRKLRPQKAYTLPNPGGADPNYPGTAEVIDFCCFSMDNKDCYAVFTNETPKKLYIYNGTSWSIFRPGTGYAFYEGTIEGVRFIASFVGGLASLRMFPLYPTSTSINEWLPLKIFNMPAETLFEKWTWTRQNYSAGPPPLPFMVEVCSPGIIGCACEKPLPCGGDYSGSCAYTSKRILFDTYFNVGDTIAILYNRSTSVSMPVWVVTKVLAVANGPEDYQMVVDNRVLPRVAPDPLEVNSPIYKLGSRSTTSQSAELLGIRGLPQMSQTRVDSYTSFALFDLSMIPPFVTEAGYTAQGWVEYGFSYVGYDNQHSNMMTKRFFNCYTSAWNPALGAFVPVIGVNVTQDIFPPTSGAGDAADYHMAKNIKGLNVWRKNASDGEWFLLGYIPRIPVDDESPINIEKQAWVNADYSGTSPGPGTSKQYFAESYYGSDTNIACRVDGCLLDWGQVLSDTIYSVTEGLNETDLGVEVAMKAPALFGGKLYAGNVATIKRWDSGWTPKWNDDRVLYSLPEKLESFNSFSSLDIARGESDNIVKISFLGRQMLIIKKRSIPVIEILGESEATWKLAATLSDGVTYDYNVLDTGYGILLMGREEMYLWDGQKRVPIAEAWFDSYRLAIAEPEKCRFGYDILSDSVIFVDLDSNGFRILNLRDGAWVRRVPSSARTYKIMRVGHDGRAVGCVAQVSAAYDTLLPSRSTISGNDWYLGTTTVQTGSIVQGAPSVQKQLITVNVWITYATVDGTAYPSISATLYAENKTSVTVTKAVTPSTSVRTDVLRFEFFKLANFFELALSLVEDAGASKVFKELVVWQVDFPIDARKPR